MNCTTGLKLTTVTETPNAIAKIQSNRKKPLKKQQPRDAMKKTQRWRKNTIRAQEATIKAQSDKKEFKKDSRTFMRPKARHQGSQNRLGQEVMHARYSLKHIKVEI